MSNAKSETVKYYNENPGSYNIVYSTDMIEDYVSQYYRTIKTRRRMKTLNEQYKLIKDR